MCDEFLVMFPANTRTAPETLYDNVTGPVRYGEARPDNFVFGRRLVGDGRRVNGKGVKADGKSWIGRIAG